jgi:AI-2E family transporter
VSTTAQPVVIETSGSSLEPFLAVVEPLMYPIVTLVLVFLLSGFLLANREDMRNRVFKLMGSDDIRVTTVALDDAGNRVGRMLLSQVALNAAFGTVIGIGLWIIGIPSPLLWGLFAGVMRFVPYVGAIIGLVPALALAFAIDPTWTTLLLTVGLFLVIEPIVGHVIEPMLYGHNTGVSPVAIVVLATIWAFLWGPIGLVLSTPITICLVVMGRHFPRLQFLQTLLGDKPALAPDETLYQNWLVGDAESAVLSTRDNDSKTSLVDYLDTVTLPAMRRANLDFVRGHLDTTMQEKLGLVSNRYVETLARHDKRPTRRSWLALSRVDQDFGVLTSPAVRAGAEAVAAQEKFCAIVHGDQPLDEMMARLVGITIEKFGIKTVTLPLTDAQKLSADVASGCWAVVMSFVEPSSTLHMRAYTRGAHRLVPGRPVLFAVWQSMEESRLKSLRKLTRAQAIVSSFGDVSVIIARWLAREGGMKKSKL